jgi:phosphotransacetylase
MDAKTPPPEARWPFGDALVTRCRPLPPARTAVVHPCDETSVEAAVEAAALGLITPVLIGPERKILAAAERAGVDVSGFQLISTPHSHAAADRAVALVREGAASLMMKGSLHTDELMHAVLAPDSGLRTGRRVSHVYLMQADSYPKPLLVTDGAINISPTLEDKRDIAQNAIDLARAIGIARPKLAVLSAVETVSSRLPSTIDAAALCKMADRGQITGGVLDGPLAFDNAISPAAAAEKGIVSEVAGDADILLAPDLMAGNILAKQLTFLGGAHAAGVVLGARVPIILTSRADSEQARVVSCALAVLWAESQGLIAPQVEAAHG